MEEKVDFFRIVRNTVTVFTLLIRQAFDLHLNVKWRNDICRQIR